MECKNCYFNATCIHPKPRPKPSVPGDEGGCQSFTSDDDMRRADYADKEMATRNRQI